PAYLAGLPDAEARYRDALLGRLGPRAQALVGEPSTGRRPDAQLVFCIDVRSEPLRRAIEDRGDYETFGFAGFFGVPVRVKGRDDDHAHDSCPVLLRPDHEVCDRVAEAPAALVRRHERGRMLWRLPGSFYGRLKYHFATPFALVEMLGPWLALRILARTFAPSLLARLSRSIRLAVMPPVPTEPVLQDIPLEQQADFGESALRMMGLTGALAPLVVFCGHGSTTTNNAHASALDCGACGGNRGGPNARILAAILNDRDVRANLVGRGLVIPPDTLFLSGEHDTATDRIALHPAPGASPEHQRQIEKLCDDLTRAGARNARDRSRSLGLPALDDDGSRRAVERRSVDWAEVRPEWGLARNAAFIVGPRALTRGIDLDGRCFLHSYDWTSDPSGTTLEAILTAPMVVAQWINSQYFFSTVDNVADGSGSKATQNVAGKIGVMQGNASDLMHGLPLQSVHADDGRPYHEPLRLLTVVQAPRSSLDEV
ncbi:MAG: putative inorganic carbon transporter subunit DabA, partial [Isosphaeraceae bacterium]